MTMSLNTQILRSLSPYAPGAEPRDVTTAELLEALPRLGFAQTFQSETVWSGGGGGGDDDDSPAAQRRRDRQRQRQRDAAIRRRDRQRRQDIVRRRENIRRDEADGQLITPERLRRAGLNPDGTENPDWVWEAGGLNPIPRGVLDNYEESSSSGLCNPGPCRYPDDTDSAGRRCGRRAASVKSGGCL